VSNYELLAKHQKAAANTNKVKHPVKDTKVRDMGKKEERRMMRRIG